MSKRVHPDAEPAHEQSSKRIADEDWNRHLEQVNKVRMLTESFVDDVGDAELYGD